MNCNFFLRFLYFNTSYVVIKPDADVTESLHLTHFNTSYVVIKLFCSLYFNSVINHFNTSYVVIKQHSTNKISFFS